MGSFLSGLQPDQIEHLFEKYFPGMSNSGPFIGYGLVNNIQ